MTSSSSTSCHLTRPAIEPSSIDVRNSCEVSCRFNPRATLAPGFAARTYHASALPCAMPIDRAKESSGWTWIESGCVVKSASKAELTQALSGTCVETRVRRWYRHSDETCSRAEDQRPPTVCSQTAWQQVPSSSLFLLLFHAMKAEPSFAKSVV